MYVSFKYLHDDMGVDEKIGRFFVDRKIPSDNIFWKKRLLYIGRGNGFISIPVYYDLLFRIGVPQELLLAEQHVQLMEKIMHYAISVEHLVIGFKEQLSEISALLRGRIKNEKFYSELLAYLHQPVLKPAGDLGMQIPSLNRADVFLFILCDLPLTDEQMHKAIKYWYALHTSYLLMDDMYDYKSDKDAKEENAVIELGDGELGFEKAFGLLKGNTETLRIINPSLASFFEESMTRLYDLIP
ncbi:MAG: hypothetical protein JST75_15345 [Bacteroidetes bacterium]|nr:hypothetical protein [Bacteroidota bacterium]